MPNFTNTEGRLKIQL